MHLEVKRSTFNSVLLSMFWRFLAERQRVWYRRVVQGKPPPWTSDRILREEHFTNVYRELDPGTVFVFDQFLDNPRLTQSEKAWHIMNYRLTGSNRHVYRLAFPQRQRAWEAATYAEGMHRLADKGTKVWGQAYTVTGAVAKKGESKIDAIARVIDIYTKDWPALFGRITRPSSMEGAFKAINGVYGFGPFLAYQALIDMIYEAEDGRQVLQWDPNEWATLGLGAKQGIQRVLVVKARPLDVLKWLVANQEREFQRVGEQFMYLRNKDGSRRLLTLQSFQTCLCEFWKFSRRKAEGQRSQRKFIPQHKLHVPGYVRVK